MAAGDDDIELYEPDSLGCERCGDVCSEMVGGLCCDCVHDRCDNHGRR